MSSNAIGGADTARLKQQIETLRGENASLRSTAKRDSEAIVSLNNEIRFLISVDEAPQQPPPATPFTNKAAIPPLTSNCR